MRPSLIADIDVPLSSISEAKQRRRQMVEDTRRYRVAVADPNAPKKSPWKKRDEKPLGPEWEFERDQEGKVTLAKQLRVHPNSMDSDPRFLNRRFICVIEGDPCAVGGEHVEHGAKVDCFADTALGIHGHRGRILEEYSA